MSLVAASEHDIEQTESFYESKRRCGVSEFFSKKLVEVPWNKGAIESESLVNKALEKFFISRVACI